MEKFDNIPVDGRITIGKAIDDYSKVITGGNETLEEGQPTEEKELSDEEKKLLKIAALKKAIHKNSPRKKYGTKFHKLRHKKSSVSKKSRVKNR